MFLSRIRKLRSDRNGNVMVIFGLASLPLLAVSGIAVDYGFATRLQTRLQAATDATAINLCKTALGTPYGTLQSQAQTMMTGYMGNNVGLVVDYLWLYANPRRILLKTHATSTAFFGRFTGTSRLTVGSTAGCATPMPKDVEFAIVLDNTGSMGNAGDDNMTKIEALKLAAHKFVDNIFSNPAFGTGTRISIVPFAATAALSPSTYKNANWVDKAGQSAFHWRNITGADASNFTSRFDIFAKLAAAGNAAQPKLDLGWAGCFQALPYPQNITDMAVTAGDSDSLYVPYFAPDEPGPSDVGYQNAYGSSNSGNSYIDDSNGVNNCAAITGSSVPKFKQAETRACKYVSPQNVKTGLFTTNGNSWGMTGPNFGCTVPPLQLLTRDKDLLHPLIDKMVAGGNTNIHEGFMWGWRTISPNSVFGSSTYTPTPSYLPKAYDSDIVDKVIVVMTDGANAWPDKPTSPNSSMFAAYGYYANASGKPSTAHFPTGTSDIASSGDANDAIDALTREACGKAKGNPANITIFTIGFSTSGNPISTQGKNLLKSCAGGPGDNPLNGRFIPASDATSLDKAFSDIAGSVGALRLSQ